MKTLATPTRALAPSEAPLATKSASAFTKTALSRKIFPWLLSVLIFATPCFGQGQTPGSAGETPSKVAGEDGFLGSFFDFLTKLAIAKKVQVGIDPECLQARPEMLLQKTRVFSLSPKQGVEAYLTQLANESRLSLHKVGPYYLFTESYPSTLDEYRKAFTDTSYNLLTATAAPGNTGGQGSKDPIRDFNARLAEARKELAARRLKVEQLATRCKGLQRDALRYERGGALAPPDIDRANATIREVSVNLDELTGILMNTRTEFWRAEEAAPNYFQAALESRAIPMERLRAEITDLKWRLAEVFEFGLESAQGLYSDVSGVTRNLDSVKHDKDALTETLRELKRADRLIDGARQQGLKLWTAGKTTDAYREFARSYETYQDRSPRTRLGMGILLIKNRAERIAKNASPPKERVPFHFFQMAGLEKAAQEKLKVLLANDAPLVVPRVKHPSRAGSVYGLAVNSAGEGSGSTFAVQLLEKEASAKTPVVEANPEQRPSLRTVLQGTKPGEEIEIHHEGKMVLDENFRAAVRDAMQCITQNFGAKVLQKRVLVELDRTAGIAYGGDSAGAALAIAGLSRERNLEPVPDVCMTGAIRAFGDIRPVGGIGAKVTGAMNEGFGVILVPAANMGDLMMQEAPDLESVQIVTGSLLKDYMPFALPGASDASAKARKALETYAMACHLYKAGRMDLCRGLLEKVLDTFPNHFSAFRLNAELKLGGVPRGTVPPELL